MSDTRAPDRFGRLDRKLWLLNEQIAAKRRERESNADSAAIQTQARHGLPIPSAPVTEPTEPTGP
jgi:hypothetical protein